VDQSEAIEIRPMTPTDVDAVYEVFAAVAAEGRWIAREAPVDRDESRRYLRTQLDDPDAEGFVAVDEASGRLVGQIGLTLTAIGVVDLGMIVADGWRSRGVGSALLAAGIGWARERGAHKMALQVWPHNERALGLYEKYGFAREGVLRQHYRRANGDLWDAIVMGLLLAD
jgi:RimJ/RimL family protein N-acetyltransferase